MQIEIKSRVANEHDVWLAQGIQHRQKIRTGQS
jgi:hypothetical protein